MIDYGQSLIDPAFAIRPNLLKWLETPPRFAYDPAITAQAELVAWQKKARKQFEIALGQKLEPVHLLPKVLATEQMDGYRRMTLSLATAPNLRALCWLLLPDGVSQQSPRPAMIATPGHGIGAKDTIAMDVHGKPRQEGEGYQKDYALQALRCGYVVLVVEPLGFGERRDIEMLQGKTGETGCHAASTMALMLGTTLARIRIHEISRAIDYLQTRPEVQANRIGLMGISGGGQITLWTRAIEKRIKAAVVSGYLNRFRDSVLGMHHCVCNFVPGLAQDLDMTDLAMLGAPGPMLVEGGTQDPIFPIKATQAAVKLLRKSYKNLGYADRIVVDVFEADHQWSGKKLEQFLSKNL